MLSVRNLAREFGDRTALDGVSFDVRPGRMTGFVGANGAGKTTTMRIMVGVLAPTRGEVLWEGSPITTQDRRRFGYMPEERGLYPKLPVADQLQFFGRLHGMTTEAVRARVADLLDRLGLTDRSDALLETLSLGNQQRVQIAAALLHQPTALILDEPFSGLDPLAVDAMTALLKEDVAQDVPVLFSSHQLDLVERLCDDLVILSEGRMVAAGPVDELRTEDSQRYRITLAHDADAGWLREVDGLAVLDVSGPRALVDPQDLAPEKLLELIVNRSAVVEFAPVVRPLSEIYREAIR